MSDRSEATEGYKPSGSSGCGGSSALVTRGGAEKVILAGAPFLASCSCFQLGRTGIEFGDLFLLLELLDRDSWSSRRSFSLQ